MHDDGIPIVQRAAVIRNPGPDAEIVIRDDVPVSNPGPDEVLVKIHCVGLCGSDARAFRGWGPYDPIAGHEGIGRVVKLGQGVSQETLGRKVGVKWLYSACGTCSACSRGYANNCPNQLNTGKQRPGTLQQYVVADARYLALIPEDGPGVQLGDQEAAPLLCAGLTMMGAISKLKDDLSRGDWVVIQGSGGGLGHLGVQIAARLRGYRVIAVDAGPRQESISKSSGAEAFIDYVREDVEKAVMDLTGEGAHAVVVVPESEDAYRVAPKLVRSMGTIVCVGLPHGGFNLPIPATLCAAKALNIRGTMVGTEAEMTELLEEAAKGRIRASAEPINIAHIEGVMRRLVKGEVVGRVVVNML